MIDRKFRILATNPINGKQYTEANSLLLCAKDAAVPAALEAYAYKCYQLGANPEHIRSIQLLVERVEKFQQEMGGGRVPDTVGKEIETCIMGDVPQPGHCTEVIVTPSQSAPITWTRGDCLDMETIAKELHEAGRAAVERGATVAADKGDQSRHFIEWGDITENAREGRRIQALYLLNKYDVVPKVIEPKTFGSAL